MPKSDAEIMASIEQLGRFFMGTSDVHIAMARVVKTLEELGLPYAICGAMAVNVHGLQRATEGEIPRTLASRATATGAAGVMGVAVG